MGVYPKKEVDTDVLTLARERVSTVFDKYDLVSVSFSGGKDSTVVLNLALEEARRRSREIEVVFFDEEAIHPETIDYVARVAQLDGIKFRWMCWSVKHRNACSRRQPWWYPWAKEDEAKWCRPAPVGADMFGPPGWESDPSARKPMPDVQSIVYQHARGRTVGVMLGIRAAESLRRYRSVAKRIYENWIAPDPNSSSIYLCKPIYDWGTLDVWTAPAMLGWDYNRAYDRFAQAGVTPHAQRVCPPFGEEPLQGLYQYAICWPDLWEKMLGRVAGVGTAGRYARTPLYGSDTSADKPDGMTWQEAIAGELMKWTADERKEITTRIREDIAAHNRRTNNAPIKDLDDGFGLSWQFLLKIARRGDLKRRKSIRGYNDQESDK